jgi:hypothetical protein
MPRKGVGESFVPANSSNCFSDDRNAYAHQHYGDYHEQQDYQTAFHFDFPFLN